MLSTKAVEKTIPEIERKFNSVGGDMLKIEYLENCLKQMLPNDAKRFCHIKLSELYASKLMYKLAAKNMEEAAECATSPKDKIKFYMDEVDLLIKNEDYFLIDKSFKKAMSHASPIERKQLQDRLKSSLMKRAEEFERRGKNNAAAKIYERMRELPSITEQERIALITKLGQLYSKTGKIRDAMRYEQMARMPPALKKPTDGEGEVNVVSYKDLGIDEL